MREGMGLYKAKRIDNGEWVEGYFFAKPILEKYFIIEGENQWMVDLKTVCEWTGLVDKNGAQIFEGDILHSDYGENYKVFYTTKSCSFMAECIQGNAPMLGNYRMGACWSNTIEVIDSIHDKAVEE